MRIQIIEIGSEPNSRQAIYTGTLEQTVRTLGGEGFMENWDLTPDEARATLELHGKHTVAGGVGLMFEMVNLDFAC